MTVDWIEFFLNTVGGTIAFLCLFDGTRRIGAHGMHRKAALTAGFAAAFYLVYGSFAFWNYLGLTDTLSMRPQVQAGLPPLSKAGGAARDLSPEHMESRNIARVRRVFWESGRFEPYRDRLNQIKVFQPSHQDIRRRERLVANQAQLEYAARSALIETLMWLVTGVLAVLFGYALSREKRSAPAGPAAAADAPGSDPRTAE